MTRYRIILICTLVALLAGCATVPKPVAVQRRKPAGGTYYTVRRGDTLWRVSKLHGVTVDELIKANRLPDAEKISVGQKLYIPRVASVSAPPPPRKAEPLSRAGFVWPVAGKVVHSFGATMGPAKNKGIDIAARRGTRVVASRSGTVSFTDEHMKGLGKTVIVDHGDGYSSVYGHNSEILVAVGDSVDRNQTIARVGDTGRAEQSMLHFEIRKRHEPQNPFHYLP